MARKRGRRLWVKMETQSGLRPVYSCKSPPLDSDGEMCAATLDPMTHEIEVDGSLPIPKQKRGLLHEGLHTIFDDMAEDTKEKIFGTKDIDKRSELEESIVSALEGPLYDLLSRNAWLKIPNPPKLK